MTHAWMYTGCVTAGGGAVVHVWVCDRCEALHLSRNGTGYRDRREECPGRHVEVGGSPDLFRSASNVEAFLREFGLTQAYVDFLMLQAQVKVASSDEAR